MNTELSRETAKEFLYRSPLADELTGMYKELTEVVDVPVRRTSIETGATVVHASGPLILRNGIFSKRYNVMLLSNGEGTQLLVVDPLRGEPSDDSMQTAQLVAGLEASSFAEGGYWLRLNPFNTQTPQRALEPKIYDYLLTRVERAFRNHSESPEGRYFTK